jgi:hypothetical protein
MMLSLQPLLFARRSRWRLSWRMRRATWDAVWAGIVVGGSLAALVVIVRGLAMAMGEP